MRKLVFRVSDKVRHKPSDKITGASYMLEISDLEILYYVGSNYQRH